MVAQVYGRCNASDVIFGFDADAGTWSITVPAARQYVIELCAVDEAGNEAYFATIEVFFDARNLCWTVRVTDVGAQWSMTEVLSLLSCRQIKAAGEEDGVSWTVAADPLRSKVIVCERCGE